MEYMSSPYSALDSSSISAEWIHHQNQQTYPQNQQTYQEHPHQNQQILQMIPVPAEIGLEEAMWGMSLGQPPEGMDAQYYPNQYPERPDEPDCSYYMRTGVCGFGANCKFNHPPSRRFLFTNRGIGSEYPERHGQPECQYYLKTGNCKFGPSCKFHHPREKAGTAGRAQLNALNLPLRPGEKDCAYYMRTGGCKYGVTCKFHHPPPMLSIQGSALMFPGSSGNSSQIPHQTYPSLSGWSIQRPPYLSSPGPSDFTPILIPSPQVTIPSWNPYSGGHGIIYNRFGHSKYDHSLNPNVSAASYSITPVMHSVNAPMMPQYYSSSVDERPNSDSGDGGDGDDGPSHPLTSTNTEGQDSSSKIMEDGARALSSSSSESFPDIQQGSN